MRRKLSTAFFAAAAGCAAAASGFGVPYRVADLNQGGPQNFEEVGFLGELGGRGPLSSWPGRPVLVGDPLAGGTLYFSADDGITGSELWALPVAP